MKTVIATLLALLAIPAPLMAETVRHEYRAYLGGIPLGSLQTEMTMLDEGYRAGGSFEASSLIGLFISTTGEAKAEGALAASGVKPARFAYTVRGREIYQGEMLFDGGSPRVFTASPERDPRDYDISIDEAAGALDPASAIVLLSAPRDAACALSLDVFDGRKRHRLSLRPASRPSKQAGITKCQGTYERIAGFKDKHMTDEERVHGFDLWLRERGSGKGWIPQRIQAKTSFGPAILALRD